MSDMKRYNIWLELDSGDLVEDEVTDGKWVRFEDAEAATQSAVEAERDRFLEFLRSHESITDRQIQDWLWTIRAREGARV